MQHVDIQTFSYDDRSDVLPSLTLSFADCGGWVIDRRNLSANLVEFRIELQLRSILELYASLISSGLELTRSAHLSLTDLCTCRRNAYASSQLGQVVALRLEITFLEDVTLHSLLQPGGIPA